MRQKHILLCAFLLFALTFSYNIENDPEYQNAPAIVQVDHDAIGISERPVAQLIGHPKNHITVLKAQTTDGSFFLNLWNFLKENWLSAILGLLALIEIIVQLTPTERDNAWFKWLRDFINQFLPNNKKGGGEHTT